MDKMRMESLDMTAQNIEKIGALFPNCVTETTDEDGKLRKAINFDILRQMLSGAVVERDEAYEFTWVGKNAAMVEASKPIRKTLRPCLEKSKNWDVTENLYLEGDNLEVLKLLQESYLGQIKLIYIDPPYNTGNDFVYRDDFSMDSSTYEEQMGMFDEAENRLFKNTDTNGRFHSDWCSMMYSRLLVARNLLSTDGAIFISIDDHEVDNLKKICDEVFGANCYVADISWQRTYSPRNDSKGVVCEVEHILVYSKNAGWIPNSLPRTAEMDSKYKNPDNDVKAWTSSDAFAPDGDTHQGMVYAIQHPFTGAMIYPSDNAHWRYQQKDMLEMMQGWCPYELKDLDDAEKRAAVCGLSVDDIKKDVCGIVLVHSIEESAAMAKKVYERGQWPRFYFTKGGLGGIRRKTYIDSVGGKLPTNFWPYSEVGHTDEAKKELKALFDNSAPFDTPKPVRLMDRILTIASDNDSLVLDFFSGSATMAQAVMEKNRADGGCRKFILVQLPEESSSPNYKTLCDIGEERIRRAGEKIQRADPLGTQELDVGFRVFKLDTTNMMDVYYSADAYSQDFLTAMESNIKADRTELDLLFGCLLEWGLPLSEKFAMFQIDGVNVYAYGMTAEEYHDYKDHMVTYQDGVQVIDCQPEKLNAPLVACFAENVPDAVIKRIAKMQPLRAVFRDSCFADSPSKINVFEIFKMLAPDTRVKVI